MEHRTPLLLRKLSKLSLMSRNLYFSECIRTNPDQFDILWHCATFWGVWWSLVHLSNFLSTVVTDWESIKPHLWSKLSLFETSLQMLELQLQLSLLYSSLPYLRPFQWGTVSPYISRGIKNMTSQSWKFNYY